MTIEEINKKIAPLRKKEKKALVKMKNVKARITFIRKRIAKREEKLGLKEAKILKANAATHGLVMKNRGK